MGQFVMMTHTSNITYCFVSTSRYMARPTKLEGSFFSSIFSLQTVRLWHIAGFRWLYQGYPNPQDC